MSYQPSVLTVEDRSAVPIDATPFNVPVWVVEVIKSGSFEILESLFDDETASACLKVYSSFLSAAHKKCGSGAWYITLPDMTKRSFGCSDLLPSWPRKQTLMRVYLAKGLAVKSYSLVTSLSMAEEDYLLQFDTEAVRSVVLLRFDEPFLVGAASTLEGFDCIAFDEWSKVSLAILRLCRSEMQAMKESGCTPSVGVVVRLAKAVSKKIVAGCNLSQAQKRLEVQCGQDLDAVT